MYRLILAAALSLAPAITQAQSTTHTMDHSTHSAAMTHTNDTDEAMMEPADFPATEPGQGAFAAIGEIVAALEADPATDWSKVDISALREHLRDMNIVTIDAIATAEAIHGGMRFTATGGANVSPSIKRMVLAHASVMQGVNGWQYEASEIENGAVITVMVPHHDMAKIKALGFFGMMTSGMHHQAHHWMMATGSNPHNH